MTSDGMIAAMRPNARYRIQHLLVFYFIVGAIHRITKTPQNKSGSSRHRTGMYRMAFDCFRKMKFPL